MDGRRVHAFKCTSTKCLGKGRDRRIVKRYLDTTDSKSTGNLRKHAKLCWTEDAIKAADATKDLDTARGVLKEAGSGKLRDGSLTAKFERVSKGGKITYSHRQHTKTETKYVLHFSKRNTCAYLEARYCRAEIVRWVAENMRPFAIVKDRGFLSLMKTGRPGYYIPSPETVSRDVKRVFVKSRQRIAKMLRVNPCTFEMLA